jgi:hypothetical protein
MKTPIKYGDFEGNDQDIIIDGCRLICTCGACPEQYDVFNNKTGEQLGYLRLRHGNFRADYLDCGGETVYEARPTGDGMFDEDERLQYLTKAVNALLKHHKTNG